MSLRFILLFVTRHSAGLLLLLAAAFGVVGGPLAYYTGERLGGIMLVEFTAAMIALGIGWSIMMPLLSALSRRFDGIEPRAGDQPLIME